MVIWKVSFEQKQQLKLRFLLSQMFELIIGPESSLSFNCPLWKEGFFRWAFQYNVGVLCSPSLLCPMILSPVDVCRSLEMGWWGPGRRWHSLACGPHLLASPHRKKQALASVSASAQRPAPNIVLWIMLCCETLSNIYQKKLVKQHKIRKKNLGLLLLPSAAKFLSSTGCETPQLLQKWHL